jgi:general stress protein YciG
MPLTDSTPSVVFSAELTITEEHTMANQGNNQGNNSNRGFASMDDDQQRKIAQKGGEAVSQDREHMSEIGRKGGEASGGGNRGGNQGGNRGGNQGGRNG